MRETRRKPTTIAAKFNWRPADDAEISESASPSTKEARFARKATSIPITPLPHTRRRIMPRFSPEFIQTMRTVLDEVMTTIPPDQATSAIKARVAELILKTAASGQTSYYGLIAAASGQIQTILSGLT
jgi:hypothetical protein